MTKELTPDLSAFRRRGSRAPGGKCIIGRALDELDAQDRVNVEAALAKRDPLTNEFVFTHASIVDYLAACGHTVSDQSIRAHRKHGPNCG